MRKKDNRKQGKQEDETSLRAKNEDIVEMRINHVLLKKASWLMVLCVFSSFVLKKNMRMRFDIFVICISLYYPKDQRII